MPKITFAQSNGLEQTVEGEIGGSVMQAALRSSIEGIDADWGGSSACATCPVHLDEPWREARPTWGDGGDDARLRGPRAALVAPFMPDSGHDGAGRPSASTEQR